MLEEQIAKEKNNGGKETRPKSSYIMCRETEREGDAWLLETTFRRSRAAVGESRRVSGHVEPAKPLDLRPLLLATRVTPWRNPECPDEGCVPLGKMMNLVTTRCSDRAGPMM